MASADGAIPQHEVRDLRDRALIAVLTYSFARIGAALQVRVEDMRPQGAGWVIRLHEKGGKQHVTAAARAKARATTKLGLRGALASSRPTKKSTPTRG